MDKRTNPKKQSYCFLSMLIKLHFEWRYRNLATQAEIPLGSTRLDTFDFVERVDTNVSSVTSVSSRLFPT